MGDCNLEFSNVSPQSERHIYGDMASGRKDERPGLTACLQALREGDTLVVWKLDRLGRDLRHSVNTVHELTNGGVGLRVLTGQGAAIDTRAHGLAVEQEALGVLKQNGVTILECDREAFRKRVAPQYESFVKAHPESKPVIELIQSTAV